MRKEQYEYKTIQVSPGTAVWEGDLNDLGEKGYRLVGIVPLTQALSYDTNGKPEYDTNGVNLIFERRKETE